MLHEKKARVGVVAILVKDREKTYLKINEVLHTFSNIIVGRLGVPYHQRNMAVIALIVDGSCDEIGAMTGKLGQMDGVSVKIAFAKM